MENLWQKLLFAEHFCKNESTDFAFSGIFEEWSYTLSPFNIYTISVEIVIELEYIKIMCRSLFYLVVFLASGNKNVFFYLMMYFVGNDTQDIYTIVRSPLVPRMLSQFPDLQGGFLLFGDSELHRVLLVPQYRHCNICFVMSWAWIGVIHTSLQRPWLLTWLQI